MSKYNLPPLMSPLDRMPVPMKLEVQAYAITAIEQDRAERQSVPAGSLALDAALGYIERHTPHLVYSEIKAAMLAAPQPQPVQDVSNEFNRAIDFAIEQGSEGVSFLKCWREGDTGEWPEFSTTPQPVTPSQFGSPELQGMILARCVEKDQQPQPVQRAWVGLTDDEVAQISSDVPADDNSLGHIDESAFARAIEAKLKEKNA